MMSKRLSQDSGRQATRPSFGGDAAGYDTGSKMSQTGAGSSRTWCRMAWCLVPLVVLCLTVSHSAAQNGSCDGKFCPKRLVGVLGLVSSQPFTSQPILIYYGELCETNGTTWGYFFSPYYLDTSGSCNGDCSKCYFVPSRLRGKLGGKKSQKGTTSPMKWHHELVMNGLKEYFWQISDSCPCAMDNIQVQQQPVNVEVTVGGATATHTFKLVKIFTSSGEGGAASDCFAFEIPYDPNASTVNPSDPVAATTKTFTFQVYEGPNQVTYNAILK